MEKEKNTQIGKSLKRKTLVSNEHDKTLDFSTNPKSKLKSELTISHHLWKIPGLSEVSKQGLAKSDLRAKSSQESVLQATNVFYIF